MEFPKVACRATSEANADLEILKGIMKVLNRLFVLYEKLFVYFVS